MKVNIKKIHQDAVIPSYSREGDAGMDLVATSYHFDSETGCHVYGVGLQIEIPSGFVGKIYPRSSLSKYDLVLANHVGIIDSNYRGEILFKFKHLGKEKDEANIYQVGERIGQLIIEEIPRIELVEVKELSDSNRGANGFGSSGK